MSLFEDNGGIWISPIPEHSYAGDWGKQLLEQFQAFPTEVRRHEAHARDVAAGSRKTGYKARPQRVARAHHDDWNGQGRPPGRDRPEGSNCHDEVDVEAN